MAHVEAIVIEKVTVEPTHRLVSPEFDAAFPSVRNIDLLDGASRGAMERTWQQTSFDADEIEIFLLRDVFVVDEGIVFDRHMRLIDNLSDYMTWDEVEAAAMLVRTQGQSGQMPHLPGRSILARRRAAANYGHFMLEILPILHVAQTVAGWEEARILLLRAEPPTMDAMFRALRLSACDLGRIFMTGMGEALFCGELLVVRGLTRHGSYMSPHAVKACSRLAAAIPPGRNPRIFVKRVASHARSGVLRDEAQWAHRLARIGFHAIDPGTMCLEEQIATFKGAQHVIGVLGAAMSNIVFCTPGTQVTMLASARYPDVFFWFIAQHRRLRYAELRGAAIEVEGRPLAAGDFVIEESDMAWLLQRTGPPERDRVQFPRMRIEAGRPIPSAPNIAAGRLVPA